MSKTLRRMPSGEMTSSTKLFLEEWDKLLEPLKKALNCSVIGFDPGILIHVDGQSVDLPIPTAQRIVELYKNNRP